MMLLGVDYGRKNIGLAVASGPLAEPLKTVKFSTGVYEKINRICQTLRVTKIIVGISEGKMAEETKAFANQLKQIIQLPLEYQDETLTTKLASQKLYQAKVKKSKRKMKDHTFAACLILQEYLDNQIFSQDSGK